MCRQFYKSKLILSVRAQCRVSISKFIAYHCPTQSTDCFDELSAVGRCSKFLNCLGILRCRLLIPQHKFWRSTGRWKVPWVWRKMMKTFRKLFFISFRTIFPLLSLRINTATVSVPNSVCSENLFCSNDLGKVARKNVRRTKPQHSTHGFLWQVTGPHALAGSQLPGFVECRRNLCAFEWIAFQLPVHADDEPSLQNAVGRAVETKKSQVWCGLRSHNQRRVLSHQFDNKRTSTLKRQQCLYAWTGSSAEARYLHSKHFKR